MRGDPVILLPVILCSSQAQLCPPSPVAGERLLLNITRPSGLDHPGWGTACVWLRCWYSSFGMSCRAIAGVTPAVHQCQHLSSCSMTAMGFFPQRVQQLVSQLHPVVAAVIVPKITIGMSLMNPP